MQTFRERALIGFSSSSGAEPDRARLARMRMVFLTILVGCSSSSGGAPNSPVEAARCEAAAIRAKDFARLRPCLLPEIRDETEAQAKRRGAIDWSKFTEEAAKLEAATASDFHIAPLPEGKRQYGTEVASLTLGKDSLEVVHAADGHWYIADTGL